MNSFAVRKGQVIKNQNADVIQQIFVCNLEGFRQDKVEQSMRGPKNETRCGYGAKFRVHIDIILQRWYITVFTFEHNHEMLKEKHCRLLAANRKLSKSHKIQIKNFGNAGIKVTQMIDAFANDAWGKLSFFLKPSSNPQLLVFLATFINHHNQTVIFATAIVSNEVEGTYVWLLEQLLVAMKGNTPML
ncbi:putative protein FAR1-RELATED SEQUENCE 10 [Lathyrus oleraceus]|uniref:putative protein FAR1-RELATED SEQUENCE 10 n=1 Tax=Pisum sativum TaxID=3888 RepID=UPI0021CF6943|nr:putative protein FAR1-RELATED SEQUENCE 10 [Pisum sativum]